MTLLLVVLLELFLQFRSQFDIFIRSFSLCDEVVIIGVFEGSQGIFFESALHSGVSHGVASAFISRHVHLFRQVSHGNIVSALSDSCVAILGGFLFFVSLLASLLSFDFGNLIPETILHGQVDFLERPVDLDSEHQHNHEDSQPFHED